MNVWNSTRDHCPSFARSTCENKDTMSSTKLDPALVWRAASIAPYVALGDAAGGEEEAAFGDAMMILQNMRRNRC